MHDEDRKLIPWWPDAGHALSVSRTTMYELIRSGELPSVKIGRRRLVAVRDLDAYVEDQRVIGPGGEAA
ncbi:helix-turn-helix domain-containing protein [Actinomadura sp. LD22]|uniref:Helix-turn-helix domain-containing protein n=2 Tax=Actinomadura physcomitrii TaxID=2650748 RepID=A0A6I4M8Z7_9ACTN|nr:helix-turn-helix domain-containing protein [Actinomadura physcomitrii]